MNELKYYEAEACNRQFEHEGVTIKFRPWGTHGGCLCGVFCPETEEEAKAVAALAKDKKNLITEIDRDTFDARLGVLRLRQPLSVTSQDGTAGQRAAARGKTTVTVSAPIRNDTDQARAAMKQILSADEDAPVRPSDVKAPPPESAVLTPGPVPKKEGHK